MSTTFHALSHLLSLVSFSLFATDLRSSQPNNVSLLTANEVDGWFTRRGERCIEELFIRLNMDLDGYLNRKEIKRFLKVTQPELPKQEVSPLC